MIDGLSVYQMESKGLSSNHIAIIYHSFVSIKFFKSENMLQSTIRSLRSRFVRELPPQTSTSPGSNVTLSCTIEGSMLEVYWEKDDKKVTHEEQLFVRLCTYKDCFLEHHFKLLANYVFDFSLSLLFR